MGTLPAAGFEAGSLTVRGSFVAAGGARQVPIWHRETDGWHLVQILNSSASQGRFGAEVVLGRDSLLVVDDPRWTSTQSSQASQLLQFDIVANRTVLTTQSTPVEAVSLSSLVTADEGFWVAGWVSGSGCFMCVKKFISHLDPSTGNFLAATDESTGNLIEGDQLGSWAAGFWVAASSNEQVTSGPITIWKPSG